MALTFFFPIRVPMPQRPTARATGPSSMMAAKRTPRSPAGPMAATSPRLPWRSNSAAWVSKVSSPQRSSAGRISQPSSSIFKYTGVSDSPRKMKPSTPVSFSLAGKVPPPAASPQMPVRGERAATLSLGVAGAPVPTRVPTSQYMVFSGPRGSTVEGSRSRMSMAQDRALPPANLW